MPAIPIDENELGGRLGAVLAEASPGCTVDTITPLQGGASSITYSTTVTSAAGDPQRVVVKVAPAGLEPTRNRDVLRQARLQRALEDTDVPVPRVIAEHPGTPPEVPPFYVMSFEEGDCVEPNFLPVGEQLPPDHVRGRQLHAAGILGTLHALAPASLGLDDEPETTLDAEVDRWTKSLDACDDDLRAGTEDVGRRLAETVPAMGPTTLMHGDFRPGNVLASADRVVSVIDWELWARGDPRVDLAWFLMMANPDEQIGRVACPGMPSQDELLAAYHQARGTEVRDLEWFAALVRYKQASAASFITRNARRRGKDAPPPVGNPGLMASARTLLGLG